MAYLDVQAEAVTDALRRARTRDALKSGIKTGNNIKSGRARVSTTPLAVQACLDKEVSRSSFDLGLGARLAAMPDDPQFADVVLIVGSERFPCHRMMLVLWSGYFRRMFTGAVCAMVPQSGSC